MDLTSPKELECYIIEQQVYVYTSWKCASVARGWNRGWVSYVLQDLQAHSPRCQHTVIKLHTMACSQYCYMYIYGHCVLAIASKAIQWRFSLYVIIV